MVILRFYFTVLAVIYPVRAYCGKCSLINNTWCLLQFRLYYHVLYCVIPLKLQESFQIIKKFIKIVLFFKCKDINWLVQL